MKIKLPFTKMHATGNDFIVINEFDNVLIPKKDKSRIVNKISNRHFGIGSDGVIFIKPSKIADVKFSFYNPDGTTAEMCGNGIRCLAKYVYERKIVQKEKIGVDTLAGIIIPRLDIVDGIVKWVRVDMGKPHLKRGEIGILGDPDADFMGETIEIDQEKYEITAIGMGNPHAIVFSQDVDDIDVKDMGSKIRHLDLFSNGVNVHFVQKVGRNEFRIRSYERGVEDETLACGTGICAAGVCAILNTVADSNMILFHARGGDVTIELETDKEKIKRVYLIGSAEEVFNGEIEVEI